MRRALLPVLLALAWAAAPGAAAFAHAPAPTPSAGVAPKVVPGKKVCEISDNRLVELSGMVATASGYVVVNDSTNLGERNRVFLLDRKCNVVDTVQYSGGGPRDTEDLALSRDGKTVWIGDIGDNGAKRQTIALWKMPADGSRQPELFRLKYPDGAKDAEGLLIGGDGLPIVVTKDAKAGLYKPTGAPKKNATTPLQRVGELTLPKTRTSNPLSALGRITVTGAASSPDGDRVALRTYADAFEWEVSDGDVVAALTSGAPRVTPLPDEPFGEAITYSADGATFLTVSETSQSADLTPTILRYTPTKAAPKPAGAQAGGKKDDDGGSAIGSWFSGLSLDDITYLIGGVGVLGVALVVLGVVGIVRARKRARAAGGAGDGPDGPVTATAAVPASVGARDPMGPPYDEPDRDPHSSGAIYGAGAYRGEGRTGNVYGGGQYRVAGSYPPPDDAERDRYASTAPRGYEGGGYTGNGYSGDGYGGRRPPPEPEYRTPGPGYHYDD